MVSFLKSIFQKLGGGADGGNAGEIAGDPIEYNGFRIRPTPYAAGGQYQVCGVIEKLVDGELKQYRFVRADKHTSPDEAVTFSTSKAKQIIDEQGEKLFASAD